MSAARLHAAIGAEIERLAALGILTPAQARQLAGRYPVGRWDVLALVRWGTGLGALAAATGAVVLAGDCWGGLRVAEAALAAAAAGLLALAQRLRRRHGVSASGAALELAAGLALQGLTSLLAVDLAPPSDNWPALVGGQAALLGGMAYALRNRLLLVLAATCAFVFFGGETGYLSGWGAYWLQINYPLRFAAAGVVCLGVAWLHATRLHGPLQSFARVYAHFGLLVLHLALWVLALFGDVGDGPSWDGNDGERLAYSLGWALVCVACLHLAGRTGQRLLRGYGLTFLTIDAFTFYAQFVAAQTAALWWLHLLLMGGALVWLGGALERRRRGGTPPSGTQRPVRRGL